MTDPRPTAAPQGRHNPNAEAEEAQAHLDQIRTQAGGALSGPELARRLRLDDADDPTAKPLDWSLTPGNIAVQLLAVVLFIGVIWFLVSLVVDGVVSIFG